MALKNLVPLSQHHSSDESFQHRPKASSEVDLVSSLEEFSIQDIANALTNCPNDALRDERVGSEPAVDDFQSRHDFQYARISCQKREDGKICQRPKDDCSDIFKLHNKVQACMRHSLPQTSNDKLESKLILKLFNSTCCLAFKTSSKLSQSN